jgi:hypothetical protein
MLEELEAAAQARFVRWDARLWREVVDGPAHELARGLDAAGPGGEPALASYLRLACEAIGRGYLFPAAAGRESLFTLAFGRLIPRGLPPLPAPRRAAVLAALWNLAENLETAPVWLARIFYRMAAGWTALERLEETVAEVERTTLQPPDEKLGHEPRAVWLRPATEDRRFLPGRLHFVAPTVLCMHDRVRPGVSQGAWLVDEPLLLGAMGCEAKPTGARAAGTGWKRLATSDPRFDSAQHGVMNGWRAAATLVTSQQVVALLPSR